MLLLLLLLPRNMGFGVSVRRRSSPRASDRLYSLAYGASTHAEELVIRICESPTPRVRERDAFFAIIHYSSTERDAQFLCEGNERPRNIYDFIYIYIYIGVRSRSDDSAGISLENGFPRRYICPTPRNLVRSAYWIHSAHRLFFIDFFFRTRTLVFFFYRASEHFDLVIVSERMVDIFTRGAASLGFFVGFMGRRILRACADGMCI